MSKAFDNSQLVNGNTALRDAVKIVDGAGSGLDADSVDGLHGKDYVAKRRDYAPYGRGITFWDGVDSQQDNVNKKLGNDIFYGVAGSATINDTQYTASTPWNQHSMVGFIGPDVTMGVPPTNYGWLDVPVSPGVHNVVFIKQINRDRWTAFQVHVIDPATNTPVALLQANTNTHNNTNATSNSSFVGPYNVSAVHRATHHVWVAYALPKRYIDAYAVNGRIKLAVSLNRGNAVAYATIDINVWLCGVAVAENPNGIISATAITMHWAQHGGSGISWGADDWNNEIYSYFAQNTVYSDIRFPVIDVEDASQSGKDVFVGVISPNTTTNNSLPIFTNNETGITYRCARDVHSKYSKSIERDVYRAVYGFVVPANELGNLRTFNGMHYLSFTADTTGNSDWGSIRGVYTEVLD